MTGQPNMPVLGRVGDPEVSLWVTSDAGTLHLCCGPAGKVGELGERHLHAGTASAYETGPCCKNEPMACAFDVFGETHDIDKQVILSLALARAEGRDIGQPWRCGVHGALTFGGCCG